MRVIKFRAWDKLNKQMLEVLQICFNDTNEPYMKTGVIGFDGIKNRYRLKFEDAELMQFTGLLDMNNKEIYEGDITSIKEHMNPLKEISKQVVKWNDKEACFEGIGFWPWMMAEIIGNIYENSELLAGVK